MKQLAGELLNADTAADNADKSSVATGVLALPCKYRHLSDHELGQEVSLLSLLALLSFTGTRVQTLTPEELRARPARP